MRKAKGRLNWVKAWTSLYATLHLVRSIEVRYRSYRNVGRVALAGQLVWHVLELGKRSTRWSYRRNPRDAKVAKLKVWRCYRTGSKLGVATVPGGSTRAPLRSTSSAHAFACTSRASKAWRIARAIRDACSSGEKASTVGPEPERQAP